MNFLSLNSKHRRRGQITKRIPPPNQSNVRASIIIENTAYRGLQWVQSIESLISLNLPRGMIFGSAKAGIYVNASNIPVSSDCRK